MDQESPVELERRRLRAVLDALPVGVFICDAKGRLVEANRAAQVISNGYLRFPERTSSAGNPQADRPNSGGPVQPHEWALARALRTGEMVAEEEVELETADGKRRTVLIYALPIRDGGGVFGGVATVVDVTDRQRLLQEAQAARMEAERANQAKSEFLTMMSHEIRTPINAIIGYTEILEMGIAGPVNPAQRNQLERVRSSSAHLLGLINDVLDLAKVEAGQVTVEAERAVLQDAVDAALGLVRPQASERGLRVERRCSDKVPMVYRGDEDRVRQILVNLLSNAVKFTAGGGQIIIDCGSTSETPERTQLTGEGPWVFVSIQDTGVGIAPSEQEAVFRPFVQAESGHKRTRGGTGLGLTISRQFARLMGGDITLRSELGKGSTFTLWLPPLKPADELAAIPEPELLPQQTLAPVMLTVLANADEIITRHAQRMAEDPAFPGKGLLTEADLKDHGVTLLADIAESLSTYEQSRIDSPALLRDGGHIQQVICELHGAQRARLGWGEEQIHREYQILREVVEASIREHVRDRPEQEIENAIGTLMRVFDVAERISTRANRQAQR